MKVENLCINCMQEKPDQGNPCPHCGFDAGEYVASPNHLPPFTILNGKYLLGKVIGTGGFGIVYKAMDLYLDIVVAIKELFPANMMSRSQDGHTEPLSTAAMQAYTDELKRKFTQEARTLARLQSMTHDGVVGVKDFFEENGTVYMVMEYLAGKSLKEHLKECKRMEFPETIEKLEPMLKSLDIIHKEGIVHRDIAPDNIMLLDNGNVKLLDFGGVKDTQRSKYKSEVIQVKKGYTPMEQYQVEGKIGPWTDVYAVCATIYRCITGKLLPEPLEIVSEGIVKPSDMGVKISSQAEAALMQGLEIDYRKRTQSIAELLEGFSSRKKPKITTDEKKKPQIPVEEKKQEDNKDIKKPVSEPKVQINEINEVSEKNGSRKWMIILLALVAAGGSGFCTYHFLSGDSNRVVVETVSGMSGDYRITSAEDDQKCLSVPYSYLTGASLQFGEAGHTRNECFTIEENSEGEYALIDVESGLALTRQKDDNKEIVVQKEFSSDKDQYWKLEYNPEKSSYLISCESGSDGSVYLGGNAQNSADIVLSADVYDWNLEPLSEEALENTAPSVQVGEAVVLPDQGELFTIHKDGKVLGLEENYTDDGIPVVLGTDQDKNCQKFYLDKEDDSYYQVHVSSSESMLSSLIDGDDGSSEIVQWAEKSETCYQDWEFLYMGLDQFTIRNANGGYIGLNAGDDSEKAMLSSESQSDDICVWELRSTEYNLSDEAPTERPFVPGMEYELEEGIYRLTFKENPDQVLAVEGGYSDNGMPLVVSQDEKSNCQLFRFTRDAEGNYAIQAVHTDKYIIANEDDTLSQYECDPSQAYQWKVLEEADNTFFIQNQKETCIGKSSEKQVSLQPYDEANEALYFLLSTEEKDENEPAPIRLTKEPGDVTDVTESTYSFSNKENKELYISVRNGFGDDGTDLIGWEGDGILNRQKFNVAKNGTYYSIHPVYNDKVLRLASAEDPIELNESDRKYIREFSGDDNISEVCWEFVFADDDYLYIRNEDGNCLDMEKDEEGNYRITLNPYEEGKESQQWMLSETAENPDDRTAVAEMNQPVQLKDGYYEISSLSDNVSCWAISEDENAKDAFTWERSYEDPAQKIYLELIDASEGRYRIRLSPDSDQVITLVESDGDWILRKDSLVEGAVNQTWILVYTGFGSFMIQVPSGQDGVEVSGGLVTKDRSIDSGEDEKGGMLRVHPYSDDRQQDMKWYINPMEKN